MLKLDDGRSHRWSVSGTSCLPFIAEDRYAAFAMGRDGRLQNLDEDGIGLRFRRHRAVNALEVRCDDPSIHLVRRPSDAPEVDLFEVVPLTSRPLGEFDVPVTVQPLSDVRRFEPRQVAFRGQVEGDITWDPATVLLSLDERSAAPETVTLRSRTGAPFHVESIDTEDEGLNAEVVSSGASPPETVIAVNLLDDTAAQQAGLARILVIVRSDAHQQPVEVPITVVRYGGGTSS